MNDLPRRERAVPGKPGGYTLLEIALVVAIIGMIVGVAVPMTSGFMREQRLRDVVRELLVLAKTARADAMTTGRMSEVVFAKKEFGLRRPGDEEPSEIVGLPQGMAYVLIPFGSEKAVRPDGQRWVFRPTGLCEPLRVRVEEGEAWMEVSFDPLTASLDDESYHIP
ncbi:MAG: prepilin-type N-terminal cleavage/methylation domain-containing protein [Chthoniobacterales bacterium]|nr:prepilin-type N-terminal cleavage/methylation domain-containing protein [Chthoniobacterales bacterium]